MIGDKLVVLGGVWLHSDSVPGGVVISLSTHCSVEFSLDMVIYKTLSVLMYPPYAIMKQY